MRYAGTIAALALTLTAWGCAGAAKQQEFTREDADAVRKNTADLNTAINEKQVDKAIELYAENSVLMPPNAPVLRGRDPLKSFYGDLAAKGVVLQLETEEVAGYGPIAYEAGTYSLTYENGNARDRGKYVRVLRNTNGTWRTEKTIWSSDLPPSSPPAN